MDHVPTRYAPVCAVDVVGVDCTALHGTVLHSSVLCYAKPATRYHTLPRTTAVGLRVRVCVSFHRL